MRERIFASLAAVTATHAASAQPVIIADSGDSAWVLAATVLAMIAAVPGLALFYGGRVRAGHAISVMTQGLVAVAVASLVWAIAGYSLAFGAGSSWIGGFGNLGLAGLADLRDGTTLSEPVFALFQLAFAALAPALIVGACAERARFGWVAGFAALWSLLVYVPVARWVWGGGWLAERGALDFAGGLVMHLTAGIAALVVAILIGKRRNMTAATAHGPALAIAGAGLLWAGSLGLGGGSAFAAGADAAGAMVNTHLAACTAVLVWSLAERMTTGRVGAVSIATGAVAGLAAVAPAAGFVGPMGAILIAAIGSAAAFAAARIVRNRLRIDDALGVFAVHGVGSAAGSLLLPLFVLPLFGGPGFDEGVTLTGQLAAQALAVAATILWTAAVTTIAALMVAMVVPMRVGADEEDAGADPAAPRPA